jgi:uncharacterized protein YmfQ (DUF2313 family)
MGHLDTQPVKDLLKQLLPKGRIWEFEQGGHFDKLIHAISKEFARIDLKADLLLKDLNPLSAEEHLSDWARIVCTSTDSASTLSNVEDLRAQVLRKLFSRGSQTKSFFIKLAEYLGFKVEITECFALCADSEIGGPVFDDSWNFTFIITDTTSYLGLDRPHNLISNQKILETVIQETMPAHCHVIFQWKR